ncbi:MAG: hypothetical protein LBV42_00950 [Methanobrevibacter sp.]|jgi:hypothetical protein|nr:hypothetical protein [Methanobrevibacter sp.]
MKAQIKETYLASGFNSWEMNTAMISAIIIIDLILKLDNNYFKIFSPLRFKDKEVKDNLDKHNKNH